MIFLALSILCSVTVGVLFKFARRYQIDVKQAITWNYLTAILLSLVFFRPAVQHTAVIKANFPLYISIGFLLPVVFLFLGFSIKQAGLARTDIAQRLSLFISLTAAYFLFNETFDRYKEVAIVFGFAGILLTMYRKTIQSAKFAWLYLLLVFVGYGVIDVLFKKVSQITDIPYTASLSVIFCIAFALAFLYIIYLSIMRKIKLQFVNVVCGGILGLLNFGNIWCYLRAHQAMSDNPSTVFAAMNLGVIIIGSAIGVIVFKERLSKINYAGLVLAVIAVILITLSKIHAV